MNERVSPGLEQLRSMERPNISRPRRLLRAMGKAARRLVSPEIIPVYTTVVVLGSTIVGLNEVVPNLQIASDYLHLMEPTLDSFEAYKRVIVSDDANADTARRFMLDTLGVEVRNTRQNLVSEGMPIAFGMDLESYATRPEVVRKIFHGYAFEGGKVILQGFAAGAGLLAFKRLADRRGPESEYSPEYDQDQIQFDLKGAEIIDQVEDLIGRENNRETYEMVQTYFRDDTCIDVIDQKFGGSRKKRKKALESIKLGEKDRIIPEEFRLVTINGISSIVLRIDRSDGARGENFGKQTYSLDPDSGESYPKILAEVLSLLAPHKDVTTTKIRTVVEVEIPYTDLKTGKLGITKAFLNYDQYPNRKQPSEILRRRVEIVVPTRAGISPEVAFPKFYQILSPLGESKDKDRDIGRSIEGKS